MGRRPWRCRQVPGPDRGRRANGTDHGNDMGQSRERGERKDCCWTSLGPSFAHLLACWEWISPSEHAPLHTFHEAVHVPNPVRRRMGGVGTFQQRGRKALRAHTSGVKAETKPVDAMVFFSWPPTNLFPLPQRTGDLGFLILSVDVCVGWGEEVTIVGLQCPHHRLHSRFAA